MKSPALSPLPSWFLSMILAVGLTGGPAVGHAAPPTAARPRAGDQAPAFTLKSVDNGEPKALAALLKEGGGRGVVVAFLSAECPYVAQARQPLGELFRSFGSKVSFVGVNANQNESANDIKADAAVSYPFPMLRDEGAKVAELFAAERTPEVFLIDADSGRLYFNEINTLPGSLAFYLWSAAPHYWTITELLNRLIDRAERLRAMRHGLQRQPPPDLKLF